MRVTIRQRSHLFLVQSNIQPNQMKIKMRQHLFSVQSNIQPNTTKLNEDQNETKLKFFFFQYKANIHKKTNYKGKALNMNENEESKAIHIKNKDKGECFLTHACKRT